jgi:hypothetical protein
MEMKNDSVLMDLSDCVLVDLNISTWTGRKLDKKVSEEIDSAKGTKSRAGNYHKHLLAGTLKLEQVQKLVGTIRTWHYEQTTVWSDGGSRLLPMANFFDYKASLSSFKQQFEDAVEDFLQEYPQLVSGAAFQLGSLFDRNEYPEVETLRDKFKFRYALCPLPTANDFRIQAGEEVKRQLAGQYEEYFNNKLQDAMKDLWGRLHEVLTHMSAKLADAPTPRKMKDGGENHTQIFRDSLITNAFDLCNLLTKLNVSNDPKLEEARRKLEVAISGRDAEVIRDSDTVRHDVKRKVDEILSAFNF